MRAARPNVRPRRYGAGLAKSTPGFRCTECGWQTPKWVGRCGECQAWGTVEETPVPRAARAGIRAAAAGYGGPGAPGISGRLGGGPVSTAAMPLAGEPGVGKSTLLLEAGAMVAADGPVLYVTGEESAAQVRLRADRVGAVDDGFYIAAETELSAVLAQVDAVQPVL